jgi:hypothetical protein
MCNGVLYITDTGAHKIHKVLLDGTTTTFAGSGVVGFADGLTISSQFNMPIGITSDQTCRLFVTDYSNQRIRMITPDGTVSTYAGTGASGWANGALLASTFRGPYGIASDATGANIYVSEFDGCFIRKLTVSGVSTLAGIGCGFVDGPATLARFNNPQHIALDITGTKLFIGDYLSNRVRLVMTATGVVSTYAGTGTASSVNGAALSATFFFPIGITTDDYGNVYVGEVGQTNTIRKIQSDGGQVTTYAGVSSWGNWDAIATSAFFAEPYGLYFDTPSGVMYVCDKGSGKLRKIAILPSASPSATPSMTPTGTGTASITPTGTGTSTSSSTTTLTASITPSASSTPGTKSGTPSASATRCPYIYEASFSGYICPVGYTLSGTTCSKDYAGTVNYNCPSGYTLSGTSCLLDYQGTLVYTCNGWETLSGTSCGVSGTQDLCSQGGGSIGGGSCQYTYAATGTGVCNSGFTKSGSYCNRNTNACGATLCGTSAGGTRGCFSGTLKAPKVCSGTSYCTGAPCGTSPGGYFGSMNSGGIQCATNAVDSTPCPAGTSMYGTTCQCRDAFPQATTYSCPSGGSLSGTTCTVTYTADWQCPGGYGLAAPMCWRGADSYWSCPSGGSIISGSTCRMTQGASITYTCPTGGSLSGSTCTLSQPADFTYSCPQGGSVVGTQCILPDGQCLTPTPSNTPSSKPSELVSLTATATATGSATSTATSSAMPPSASNTGTASKTYTYTESNSGTGTPSKTYTYSASWTPTPSNTQTPTGTPTRSGTGTPSWTPTNSPTPSFTPIIGCREFYCSAYQAVLTDDSPPLCIHYYEATISYGRRLMYDGYCGSGMYRAEYECVSSCPYWTYADPTTMSCVYSCPDGYDQDMANNVCVPKSTDSSYGTCNGNSMCEPDYGENIDNCPTDCRCGNNYCEYESGETPDNCPKDCGVCGNGQCDPFESCSSCEQDCGTCMTTYTWCGDGTCNGGEMCSDCSQDCGSCPVEPSCGDGTCNGSEDCSTCYQDCGYCPMTPSCGDGQCNGGETCETCGSDCGTCWTPICGDGQCNGGEDCMSCSSDCGPCQPYTYCGDGTCNGDETSWSCSQDCGSPYYCGDGNCMSQLGEDTRSCPQDCGDSCGDNVCGPSENCYSCSQDCGPCPPSYSCANPDDILSGTSCKHVEMALVRPCSATPSQTPSQTPSRTASKTYTFTASNSRTGTPSKTYTYSASWTPTPTGTQTPTRSGTGTSTQTPSKTPAPAILYPSLRSEGSLVYPDESSILWMPTIVGNANIESCLRSLNGGYQECRSSWVEAAQWKQGIDEQWLGCATTACESSYPGVYRQECITYMIDVKENNLGTQQAIDIFTSAQNIACFGYDDLRFSYYPSIRIPGGIKHISFAQCSINIGTCIEDCGIFNTCRDSYKNCLDQTCMGTENSMECYSQMNTNVMTLDSHAYYIAEAARSEYGCTDNWSGGGGEGGSCNNNGICDSWENADFCNDCGCNNNNICESQRGETESTCWADCTCNSNGVCESLRGEAYGNCEDCSSDTGGGGSGTTCNGNPCGENIISCCSYQGSEVCANPDGSCPEQGNQCGSGTMYCNLGESCCSGQVCSSGGICPDSWNGDTGGGDSGGGDSGGGEAPSGGFDPCPGGYMGMYGCESSQPSCSYPEGSRWTGAECACEYPKQDFGGYCREPNDQDCLNLRGSSWDGTQCICASQMKDGGMGECVPYDSGSGGDQFMDPNYYRRRLRASKTTKSIKR